MSEKIKKPKGIIMKRMWAYYAPDGYIQVRSIAETRKLSREMISRLEYYTWKDYEAKGFTIHRIQFTTNVIK